MKALCLYGRLTVRDWSGFGKFGVKVTFRLLNQYIALIRARAARLLRSVGARIARAQIYVGLGKV